MTNNPKKPNTKVLTPEFRVSFPAVFQARSAFEGQEPKFSMVMLFPKNADLSALKQAANQAVKNKWPNKRPSSLRSPFRDGNEKSLDGYKDTIFITAMSKQKPGLVDKNLQQIIDPSEFYAGCWARATIVAFAYDTAGNRGVSFGLQNIQKIKDDTPFGGRVAAEDDFEAIETTEEQANEELFGDASSGGDDFGEDNSSAEDAF